MIPFVYRCTECGKEYKRDEVKYLCPDCENNYVPGNPLRGVLSIEFDYEELSRAFDKRIPCWDLFLPIESKYLPNFPVGNTPLHKAGILGKHFGLQNLWIKNDGLNPSGSLKDRASYLVVAEASRLNETEIVAASTGNAASSLSSVCAAAGKKAIIYVPASAPKAKMLQNILCGAKVIPVKGTYDDAFKLSLEHTKEKGGLNRNTAYHPFTIEGKKTVGLEIFTQNGFKVPDAILVPVGDGVIISGVYKAFYDLMKAGLSDKLPKIICAQAENSSAIHAYIETGEYENLKSSNTVADSISVCAPSNAHMARKAVLESNGFSITVNDAEIMEGQKILAEKSGVFAEPSASVTVAALQKIKELELFSPDEQIILLVTGHGLKDIETPLKNITLPEAIEVK
ncbi:MAG: threonine synthase [Bacteroidetes bacterium]|nr:threonine synthase [Bacteroidota bacterium]